MCTPVKKPLIVNVFGRLRGVGRTPSLATVRPYGQKRDVLSKMGTQGVEGAAPYRPQPNAKSQFIKMPK